MLSRMGHESNVTAACGKCGGYSARLTSLYALNKNGIKKRNKSFVTPAEHLQAFSASCRC